MDHFNFCLNEVAQVFPARALRRHPTISRITTTLFVMLGINALAYEAAGEGNGKPASFKSASPFQVLPFQIKLDTVLEHDDGKFLWFHPRVAAVPGLGRDGQMAVFMTLQKHLHISDYYSGLNVMRSNDLGTTWSKPDPRPELAWVRDGAANVAVVNVTPSWHPQTGKVLAVGAKVRYSANGTQLEDVRHTHQTSYAVLDPATGQWTKWQDVEMPANEQFNYARSAGAQFLVEKDGTVLLPFYISTRAKTPWSITVARFSFDGKQLKYRQHGNVMSLNKERGYAEPSLTKFQNRYFLTIRSNSGSHVTSSKGGLIFDPPKDWTFDDGKILGSYNTPQHWLTHSDGLFLAYTRRGANNDHIIRHRAPLFIAQVDPANLRVVRKTEKVLVPERGAALGNFGAAAVNRSESWVTVGEGVWNDEARRRGAKGALFVARVIWSKPNRMIGLKRNCPNELRQQ